MATKKKYAFELKSKYESIDGANVTLADGSTFDIMKEMKSGKLVVDNEQTADVLRGHPALKEVAVSSSSSSSSSGSSSSGSGEKDKGNSGGES